MKVLGAGGSQGWIAFSKVSRRGDWNHPADSRAIKVFWNKRTPSLIRVIRACGPVRQKSPKNSPDLVFMNVFKNIKEA